MAFTLDPSARDALRRLVTDSNFVEPVAVFSKRTNVASGSEELRNAFASGNEHALRDVAEHEWTSASVNAVVFLDVFIYERSEIQVSDIVSVDGIEFELPVSFRDFLDGIRLFYAGAFFLRNRDGKAVDLPFGPVDTRLE